MRPSGNPNTDNVLAHEETLRKLTEAEYRAKRAADEADTRRRENLGKPTRDYPGAEQMMRWQRDYK